VRAGVGKVVQLLVRIALGDPKVVRGCLILGLGGRTLNVHKGHHCRTQCPI
jgi:hypothetical protein